MAAETGRTGGDAVVLRGGVLRCVPTTEVAPLLARAMRLDEAGLEDTPSADRPSVPLPPVVEATVQLRHPVRVSRLAGRFLRRRLEGTASTLVLRTRTPDRFPPPTGATAGAPLLLAVAPIPVDEVALGASFDLIVPVGEPDRFRYATPVVTVVAARWLPPDIAASRLVDHRAFMGTHHCPGDAALLRMATTGEATAEELTTALATHEAVVVMEMLQAVVRVRS